MVRPCSAVMNSPHWVEGVRRDAGRRLVWAKLRNTYTEYSSFFRDAHHDGQARFLGEFGALPIGATATSETTVLGRSAKSQAVARSRVLACGGLQHHRATAKQYCPS